MKHIICFHLFNDYSGSPKVLKTVLEGLLAKGYRIDLISSAGGILDELSHPNLKRRFTYRYRFSSRPAVTMLRYAAVQIYTFFAAFRYLFDREAVFYVNTILPAGPAAAGWLMRKKVVYHYHENAFIKGRFYRLLAGLMQRLADEIICVSAYQASFLGRKSHVTVIPNALPAEFVSRLHPNPSEAFDRKRVLMLSSLKEYKGTREFIRLAGSLPQFDFVLVVNDTQENITKYLDDNAIAAATHRHAENLTIHPRQDDVVPFYNSASVVLNLSDKERFIETFGMTALEAMSAGLPIIVPSVGGIAEMVDDGVNGYKIDAAQLEDIVRSVSTMLTDRELYMRLSADALKRSAQYDAGSMIDNIASCIEL